MYLNLEIKELDLINLSIIYCSEQMFIDKYHQSDIYCIGANKIFAPSGFINKLANSYKFLKDSNESEVIWDANYYDLIIFKDIISINNNLNEYDKFSQKVREIYYNSDSKKTIYGTTTKKEREELYEEGIDLLSIPWVNKDN